jgi:biopolymer transport protein TolQ
MTTIVYAADSASEAAAETVNLSAVDIILNASPMVQLVLFLLIALSVLCWAIIFFKYGVMKRCLATTDRFLDIFWSGKSMDQIYSESKKYPSASVAKIFQAGYVELQRLMERERQRSKQASPPDPDPLKAAPSESAIHNLERALNRAHRTESMRLERSLTFLATTGSTAPFIGLFGTVWGIMNAFQNIGAQGGASLTTVAPSIAEALIATAVGIGCAIPALMAYNYYQHQLKTIRVQMDNFAGDFLNIVKRNFLAG